MVAYFNLPITASDDDEVFDAPAGSKIIDADGKTTHVATAEDFTWVTPDGTKVRTGDLWSSFFADGNPFGDCDVTPGLTLRVPFYWAERYGMVTA